MLPKIAVSATIVSFLSDFFAKISHFARRVEPRYSGALILEIEFFAQHTLNRRNPSPLEHPSGLAHVKSAAANRR